MSGGKVLNLSLFLRKAGAKGDRKDTQGTRCLFTEMSNLKTQSVFS